MGVVVGKYQCWYGWYSSWEGTLWVDIGYVKEGCQRGDTCVVYVSWYVVTIGVYVAELT